jgi:hypothetical protein
MEKYIKVKHSIQAGICSQRSGNISVKLGSLSFYFSTNFVVGFSVAENEPIFRVCLH